MKIKDLPVFTKQEQEYIKEIGGEGPTYEIKWLETLLLEDMKLENVGVNSSIMLKLHELIKEGEKELNL